MAEHKKFGRARKLVVAGCLVERYREQIREQIPEVDAVIGTGEVEHILTAIEGELRAAPPAAPAFLYHDATPRVLSTPRHAAYIKIAEGCDHPCSFCIIPQLRGGFRSRRFESVVREAENLAAAGVREITLIGQDTTSYGEDLGLRDGLPELLARLAQIEDLAWVRFLYAYPNRVTQRLLDTMAEHPRLVKYLDMPLQHASRGVLARMKRGSSGDAFLRLLERIRRTIPDVMLRTSFIVGFPGETEADFRELCDFVRAAEFDWMGVFAYSDVENAASHALGAKVDPEKIADRRDRLMKLQRNISARRLRRFVGRTSAGLSRRARPGTRVGLGSAPARHGARNRRQALPQRPRTAIRRRSGARPATWPWSKSPHRTTTIWSAASRKSARACLAPPRRCASHAARQISTGSPLRVLA